MPDLSNRKAWLIAGGLLVAGWLAYRFLGGEQVTGAAAGPSVLQGSAGLGNPASNLTQAQLDQLAGDGGKVTVVYDFSPQQPGGPDGGTVAGPLASGLNP